MPPISKDPVRRVPFAIASGQTTSDKQDLMGHVIVGIITPSTLTSTAITFEQFVPNADYPEAAGTWVPVHDSDGTEVSITVAADRFTAVNPTAVPYAGMTRIVAGSAEGADRVIHLVTRALG